MYFTSTLVGIASYATLSAAAAVSYIPEITAPLWRISSRGLASVSMLLEALNTLAVSQKNTADGEVAALWALVMTAMARIGAWDANVACALGHVESAAWLHDTLRGRSLCFEAARVQVVQAVASATIDGRVVSVLGTGPTTLISVGSVLVDGASAGFVLAENRVVLDVAPGQRPVELRLVVCARLAAGVLTVAESGARALLCSNGLWRPRASYELTAVDAHGQPCPMPQGGAGALEASVDGTTWVAVAATFAATATKLTVVPETWGAFSERRVVFAGRSIRVVVPSSGFGSEDPAMGHADFTFSTGSLVSASPTISHGDNNVATTGSITAARCSAGAFFATSDARLKTNVETIEGALEKCQRMRGVTFEYAADRGVVHVGLIAQEVGAVFPSLVTEIDGYQRVDYSKLVGVLIEAVKELALR